MHTEKNAKEWFQLAETAYWERHQGCAWCGGSHQVRTVQRDAKQAFHCQRCDFQISFDAQTQRYHLVPGEEIRNGMETMLEQPIANLL